MQAPRRGEVRTMLTYIKLIIMMMMMMTTVSTCKETFLEKLKCIHMKSIKNTE
jgi:hypothetical protein